MAERTEEDLRAADVPSGTSGMTLSKEDAAKSAIRVDGEPPRSSIMRDPEQRMALRKPHTVTKREIDGVTYWLDQSWGERKMLRTKLQRDDVDEMQVLTEAVATCIVDVTGLKDGDGTVVEWDGDVDSLPGPPIDVIMASLAVPDLPAEMRAAVPMPST